MDELQIYIKLQTLALELKMEPEDLMVDALDLYAEMCKEYPEFREQREIEREAPNTEEPDLNELYADLCKAEQENIRLKRMNYSLRMLVHKAAMTAATLADELFTAKDELTKEN